MENENLTVYTSPTCSWCSRVKDYLKSKGLDYQEINVAEDDQAVEKMVDLTGQRSVPVIAKNGLYVVGYKPEEIDKLLI